LKIAVAREAEAPMGITAAVLPSGVAACWLFRRLRPDHTRREARAAAVAFAVFTPISLIVAMPLAEITGGYAGFLGHAFGFVGALAGNVAVTTAVSFVCCGFSVGIANRVEGRREP
jgi:hypothetical protein